jgi:preprotein translocase subunit SecE
VVQARNPQPNTARVGMNREQSRRGGVATAGAGGRPSLPLAAAGGRGRRGVAPLDFIHDVRSELRKVVWPTQRETINLTAVVLALSIAVGLFLGGVDFLFQELFRWLLGIGGGGGL